MLDPDHVIIHRNEYARFHSVEKKLAELEARLAHENQLVGEVFRLRGGDVILKTKDGLLAPHKLKVGSELRRVIQLPCFSAPPGSQFPSGDEVLNATEAPTLRTYHRVGSLGESRTPLYEER